MNPAYRNAKNISEKQSKIQHPLKIEKIQALIQNNFNFTFNFYFTFIAFQKRILSVFSS
jgi:hypothetical protein